MNSATVLPMTEEVNGSRSYRSRVRTEQARTTRASVLAAAHDLFVGQGYTATTISQVAERAGVAVDTVYATVGRKGELLRTVVESAISGEDHAVAAEDRDYVRRVRAAATAEEKIDLYADAIAAMAPRTAPIFAALRAAAPGDAACRALHAEITGRRARNMRLFAADLRATGSLRPELSDDEVGDIVWATNSAEYYQLLVVERGWTTERFRLHLRDVWRRLLLV
jgi:AcrR family transcriptional regulator